MEKWEFPRIGMDSFGEAIVNLELFVAQSGFAAVVKRIGRINKNCISLCKFQSVSIGPIRATTQSDIDYCDSKISIVLI